MSYYVYVLSNKAGSVLYTGITGELVGRTLQHRERHNPSSFTAKYNVNRLVYFEEFDEVMDAIAREKQIKGGSRAKKLALINDLNPEWRDLYDELMEQ
jgi:putative endonuclease